MEISGYEMMGFLGIAILTIEVAVYAITVSLASRITRVTEKEIDDRTFGYEKDLKQISKVVADGEGRVSQEEIGEIQKRIDAIKASEKEREGFRESIKIENALLKPVIPSAASVLIIISTCLFIPDNYIIFGIALSFVGIIVSVLFEIPVLNTIGKAAIFEEYNPYSELTKVMDDIQKANLALTTDVIRDQTKTSKQLIERVDVLISEFQEKMGLKDPDYDLVLFNEKEERIEILDLKVGSENRILLRLTNRSDYAVLDCAMSLIVTEQFLLGKEGFSNGMPRSSDFAIYPGGKTINYDLGTVMKDFALDESFLVKSDEPSVSELLIYVVSSSHRTKSFNVPIKVE